MARICCICGKDAGLKSVMIKNRNYVCYDCAKAAGHNPLTWTGNLKTTAEELRHDIEKKKGTSVGQKMPLGTSKNYAPATIEITRQVGRVFNIDDKNRLWCISTGTFNEKNGDIHSFDEVLGVELLEDGETVVKGGAGGALVGGLLFGGVGAMVGASTSARRTNGKCSSLKIKITLNDYYHPVEYIDLLKGYGNLSISKKSSNYKKAIGTAQEILSVFQIMLNENQAAQQNQEGTVQQVSAADEIRKYKELMDEGIITEAEFEAKKRQLLGI